MGRARAGTRARHGGNGVAHSISAGGFTLVAAPDASRSAPLPVRERGRGIGRPETIVLMPGRRTVLSEGHEGRRLGEHTLDRNLAIEMVRVTEAGAMAA